jgi:hypothetical protein
VPDFIGTCYTEPIQNVWSAIVPPVRNLAPGHTVIHPNRDKAVCQLTRLIVVALLLASVVLMLILTIGGWSKLDGMKPINFVWCIVYVVSAFYVWRWARGVLPLAGALGILLLIVAVIAATGVAGTSWFDRGNTGFAAAQSLFGGTGLSADALGTVAVILAPVQLALIISTMIGFVQGWNVEREVPIEEARRRGSTPAAPPPEPAAA